MKQLKKRSVCKKAFEPVRQGTAFLQKPDGRCAFENGNPTDKTRQGETYIVYYFHYFVLKH